MDVQQVLEQVAGIMHRERLHFDVRPDGRGYCVPFPGAAVFVEVGRWRDGVMVTVTAPVLQEIGEDGPGAAAALNALNPLNRGHRFLKFLFIDGDLIVAGDLLGDTLQAGELLNLVHGTAAAAGEVAASLAEETGGLTYDQWVEAEEARATMEADEPAADPDDDIPF